MTIFDRLLIIGAAIAETAPKFKKNDSKLWEDAESERVREVILAGASRIEREKAAAETRFRASYEAQTKFQRFLLSDATRSDVSRVCDGPLVEVWCE